MEVGGRRLFIQSVCEGLDLLSKGSKTEITLELANNLVKHKGTELASEDDGIEEEELEDKSY